MRLFCLAFIVILAFPGLCLAQPGTPEVTDDIANKPAVTQPAPTVMPESSAVPNVVIDDSVEVTLPGTVVVPQGNATLPNVSVNATLPKIDVNATLPNVSVNATLPKVDVNATRPVHNATLPGHNATVPRVDVNATLPKTTVNTLLPKVELNATRPESNATLPAADPRQLTVADFLVKAPEKKPEPPKAEPQKPEVKKPEPKKSEPKVEPPKTEPQKAEPDPKKPTAGQTLKIPADAAKTGDVSFLEGCWRGYRPEYHSKRMITERFCFDDSGVGKRTIKDPTYAGDCYGATRALLNKDGVLHMNSDEAVCTSGETWGPSEMICKGEGAQTPCYWNFTAFKGKASQSYKISFVRE